VFILAQRYYVASVTSSGVAPASDWRDATCCR